jgi:hypothetical protein
MNGFIGKERERMTICRKSKLFPHLLEIMIKNIRVYDLIGDL